LSRANVTWTECVIVGVLVFGVVGTGSLLVLLGGFIAYLRTDTNFWRDLDLALVICAASAAAVSGIASWRLVVATNEARRRTGALAGLGVGIVVHPLCWLLYFAYGAARGQFPVDNPLTVVAGAALLTISSLGLLGWISAPLGALLGFLVVALKSTWARIKGQTIDDL
jgi:hypothetical protein